MNFGFVGRFHRGSKLFKVDNTVVPALFDVPCVYDNVIAVLLDSRAVVGSGDEIKLENVDAALVIVCIVITAPQREMQLVIGRNVGGAAGVKVEEGHCPHPRGVILIGGEISHVNTFAAVLVLDRDLGAVCRPKAVG